MDHRAGYRILRTVSSIDLPIESGDFKLLTRCAVNEIVRLREKQPFFRGMTRWIGLRQLEVPYDREPRFAGRASPVMSRRVIRYFLESALIAFSGVPLQISTALGLLTSLAGVFVLLYSLAMGWSGGGAAGWIGLLSAVLIVGGLQMLMLGVIGLYLYSVYVELKRRPNYIVEGTLGFESRGEPVAAVHKMSDSINSEPAKGMRPFAFGRPAIWLGAQAVNRDAPRDHVQRSRHDGTAVDTAQRRLQFECPGAAVVALGGSGARGRPSARPHGDLCDPQ